MTDYKSWDKFDVDKAEEEVDERVAVDEIQAARWKIAAAAIDQSASIVETARKTADALRSKAAVAALKEKGGPLNRRRQKNLIVTEDTFDSEALKSTVDNTLTVSIISNAIEVLSGRMADLVTRFDKLQQICDQTSPGKFSGAVATTDDLVKTFELHRKSSIALIRDSTGFSKALDILEHRMQKRMSNDAGGDDSSMKSFVATLSNARIATQKLSLQTCGSVAHLALQLGDCAVAADLSRFCIKRIESFSASSASGGSRDDGKERERRDDGKRSADKGLTAAESVRAKEQVRAEEAVVWMTRALAFAGMGSAYLASLHCRRVQNLASHYPHIEDTIKYLEQSKLRHAAYVRSTSLEKTIIDEVDRVLRRYGALLGVLTTTDAAPSAGSCSNKTTTKKTLLVVDAVNLNAGADVSLLEKLLCEPRTSCTSSVYNGESDSLNPNEDRDNTVPLDRAVHALHVDEEDSPKHFAGCDDSLEETNEPVGTSTPPLPPLSGSPAAPLVDLIYERITLQSSSSSSPPLQSLVEVTSSAWLKAMVELTRRVFYEGQILFLELLGYSAEIKYYVAFVLATAIIQSIQRNSGDSSSPQRNSENSYETTSPGTDSDSYLNSLKSYLTSIRSASLLNIIECKLKRLSPDVVAGAKKVPVPVRSPPSSDSTPVWEESNSAPLSLNSDSLTVRELASLTALQLCDCAIHLQDTLSTRLKKVLVLEKMNRFDEALDALQAAEAKFEAVNDIASSAEDRHKYIQTHLLGDYILTSQGKSPLVSELSQFYMSGALVAIAPTVPSTLTEDTRQAVENEWASATSPSAAEHIQSIDDSLPWIYTGYKGFSSATEIWAADAELLHTVTGGNRKIDPLQSQSQSSLPSSLSEPSLKRVVASIADTIKRKREKLQYLERRFGK